MNWLYLAPLALALQLPTAQAQDSLCGSLENAYGPFDYRVEKDRALRIVQKFHFTPKVANLVGGESGYLGGDLDYTLRASPNHHRALVSLANWSVQLKGLQPPNLERSVDCYFDRAFRFQPSDPLPRMIYIDYLRRLGRKADALHQVQAMLQAEKLDPYTHYNLGMLLFDLGEYAQAQTQLTRAIEQGWSQPALIHRLESVGYWPPAPASTTSAASAPEAASTTSAP